jgi:hypothetical protein
MAILDRRLIPFIEMLTELGLDWLVFELVDGIRRGRESEESAESLKLAREHVRSGKIELAEREPGASVEAEPLVGDEQLDWVANFVDERLTATLAEMAASLDNIDGIVGPIRHEAAVKPFQADAAPSPALVLLDGEEQRKVGRPQLEEARAQLPKLREALASWLASAQTGLA